MDRRIGCSIAQVAVASQYPEIELIAKALYQVLESTLRASRLKSRNVIINDR